MSGAANGSPEKRVKSRDSTANLEPHALESVGDLVEIFGHRRGNQKVGERKMTQMPWERTNAHGRTTSVLLVVALFLCGALASALFFTIHRKPGSPADSRASVQPVRPASVADGEEPGGGAPSSVQTGGGDERSRLQDSITDDRHNALVRAAQKAGPGVVTVGVTQTRYVRGQRPMGDPFDLFFHRYLPDVLYKQDIQGMGSGLIVDQSGIVLTNEHVVRKASEIKVILSDGRTLAARLLGADPSYDLAVLKVEADGLPVENIGNSDDLVVGEWAIAIGNPFGFYLNDHQPTVTVGVISAIHRDVKSDEETDAIYKDMIQTDAAINPGNSGGPLVNSLGQVVGINTFIFTQGGGSVGVGFAIPIDTAVRVSREIIQYGRTRPVWLGIGVQPMSQWLAAQLGVQDPHGLLISRIDAGSPADRAGIRELDIIREINGQEISSTRQADRTIFGAQIGDIVRFTVERKGKRLTFPLKVEAAPSGRS
jgi:serine protease Do